MDIAGLVVPDNVEVLGYVDAETYRSLLHRAGVSAVAALDGPYPSGQTVALESMAAAKATVVTHTSSLDDYVDDGATRRPVPPGNAHALAEAITETFEDAAASRSPRDQAHAQRLRDLSMHGRCGPEWRRSSTRYRGALTQARDGRGDGDGVVVRSEGRTHRGTPRRAADHVAGVGNAPGRGAGVRADGPGTAGADVGYLGRASRRSDEVWAVGMVRDEADVIGYTVQHLLAEGVDRVLIADNGSVEGTGDVLRDLGKDLPVTVVPDRLVPYEQGVKMTRLARCAAAAGAAWVILRRRRAVVLARWPSAGRGATHHRL